MKLKKCVIVYFVALGVIQMWASTSVVQRAREIPVIRDADVVVVGGGCAAVAAAIAAKTNGASVFLVAPRTYLGDDLAGTRELWHAPVPELTNQPLAQKIFTLNTPFSYTTSIAADAGHPDNEGSRLIDGVKYNAAIGSVQFNDNVSITITFAGTGTVTRLDLYYYYRSHGNSFDTVVTGVEYSNDGSDWSSAAISVAIENLTSDLPPEDDQSYLARVNVSGAPRARYLRLECSLPTGVNRQLLDEIVIHTSSDDPLPGCNYSVTPLKLKRSLEEALEQAGVPFLGASPVCDVLKDAQGNPAGVVFANRKGRQAVTARAVIDATENAWVAQQAGAVKTDFTPGQYSFSRIVIADATNAPVVAGLNVYPLPEVSYQAQVTGVNAPAGMPASIDGRVYRCTFFTNLVSGSMLELLEIEQRARDLTWVKSCIDQADRITWMPPDIIVGKASESATEWTGAAAVNLSAFSPQNTSYLFVLGVRADVTRAFAQAMSHPARLMKLADRVGEAVAVAALTRDTLTGVVLPADTTSPSNSEVVHELLNGLPPVNTNAQGSVTEGRRVLPVLVECDVLVVGAGTAGAPAAIAAGRAETDTVAIDILYNMGGVQTDGRIGKYYSGNSCGFTVNEVDPGWQATGSVLAMAKAEWYRRECREAGVRVLFGTLAAGAVVENGVVKGVVVVLPNGQRGLIRARTVIDSTGNADIAAVAGVETDFITANEPAVQGAGLALHVLGNSYSNTDIGFVDETDVADICFFARRAHASMPSTVWDAGQNPTSRERRRLVGAVTVSPIDILNKRTYPDTIAQPASDFDTHGFTVHDLFFIQDLGTVKYAANLPLRALLPKSTDGLLVTGLGISAHRDAIPFLRMQRDVQNQGYAAGYAAALAVRAGVTVRNVDITALQAHLVSKGILDAGAAGTSDSFPVPAHEIQEAVVGLTNSYASLHTVLADTNAALPLLRNAYHNAVDEPSRLVYAHVLGLLYDPTGVESLLSAVSAASWDTGWNFKGMGQVGRSVSLMDSYIIALGRARDPYAIAPVLEMAARFDYASSFSHVRSAALALENLGGGSSVDILSATLTQMKGHAFTNALIAPLIWNYSNTEGDIERNYCLKELAVARALYRLGDDAEKSAAAVLTSYAFDPREVYASHARQVLAEGILSRSSAGIWSGNTANALWDDASQWQNGLPAGGYDATADFTNDAGLEQSISLRDNFQIVGSLIFGGSEKKISGGLLDICGVSPFVDVMAGCRANLEADVFSASEVEKKGAGVLSLAGSATLKGLDVTAGSVVLYDPEVEMFQAYMADPSAANTTHNDYPARSLRTDFRVNTPITITDLGVYDSAGDGLANYKKVSIYPKAGGDPLAVLAFSITDTFTLKDGYRFRRLPEPLHLSAGEYAVVAFGYFGADRYITAGVGSGDRAGTLDDGNGALTFLKYGYTAASGARTYPTDLLPQTSDYAVSAASFRFVKGSAAKTINGPVTLSADAALDLAAVDVCLAGGLYPGAGGVGLLNNYSALCPVTLRLTVPPGTTNILSATDFRDRPDFPVQLVKKGEGVLKLNGSLGFDGGMRAAGGVLELDSPDALGDGDLSFDTGGKLRFLSGGTLDKTLYVENQKHANVRSTRLEVAEGETLTLTHGIEIPRVYIFGGFAIKPLNTGTGLTRVVFDGVHLGGLDLYLMGGGCNGIGASEHYWTGVRGDIRKLASGHETIFGSRIIFGSDCDFSVSWFDIAGSNAVVSITNNAIIHCDTEVRFVDGYSSQLSLDGGVLRAICLGGLDVVNDNNLSLKPVLFNGTVVQALSSTDLFVNLSDLSAAPLIRDGGAIFDTQHYKVAIRGRGFAQEPGSSGAFVKLGGGVLKIAAPMTYTGPTLISNGTLRLDFDLWSPENSARNLLSPATEVRVSPGAAFEVLGATNAVDGIIHHQMLERLAVAGTAMESVRVQQAELSVSALEGDWEKTGSGVFALACGPDHSGLFTGALNVREGSFAVRGFVTNLSVNVPYSSFESDPLLPFAPSNINSDKRGGNATGCPGWNFLSDDAGYQRNGSYFSITNEPACQTTNGVQTAFVRRNGAMESLLTFPLTTSYTLKFIYCPRFCVSPHKWYTNHVVKTYLGGVLKDSLTTTSAFFEERTVLLGEVAAGTYTLRFEGSSSADLCTLIDDVRVASVTRVGGAEALSSETSALTIAAGVRVELDYPGSFTVGQLMINGEQCRGGYYGAASHPDLFTGTGTLHAKSGGTLLLLR